MGSSWHLRAGAQSLVGAYQFSWRASKSAVAYDTCHACLKYLVVCRRGLSPRRIA